MPVFAFGQTRAFHWFKFGPPIVPQWLAEIIARRIGAQQPASPFPWCMAAVRLSPCNFYVAIYMHDLANSNSLCLRLIVWQCCARVPAHHGLGPLGLAHAAQGAPAHAAVCEMYSTSIIL